MTLARALPILALAMIAAQAAGMPFVDCTNDDFNVSAITLNAVVAGTNNEEVVGWMWVTNTATADPSMWFPAGQMWETPFVMLADGPNPLIIYGTNSAGIEAFDIVTITRGGGPFVDITNESVTVDNGVTDYTLAGTNNDLVVGWMWITNATAGGPSFYFPAPPPAMPGWIIPSISLAVGTNTLVVYGTNAYGTTANDSVVITRAALGVGTPFIDVTNAPAIVPNDVTMYTVAGTNNDQVVGWMWVTNATAGGPSISFLAPMPGWMSLPISLVTGANTLVVYGTNVYGTATNESVVITRGPVGTGKPFVDVTNTPAIVPNDVTTYAVSGTNNAQAVGFMWVSNATVGGVRIAFAAMPAWTAPAVSLTVGVNSLVVYGTNAYGMATNDVVVITRGPLGTGKPFVDVTNTPAIVPNDVTPYAVAGTNNAQVVGFMWVSNATVGGVRTFFPAMPAWTAPALNLAIGTNTLVVYGTNAYGTATNDSVVITRGPVGTGKPFVDVTNAPAIVPNDVTTYAVSGSNNAQVVGFMWVSNATVGGVRISFATGAIWLAPAASLTVGVNTLVVYGTNVYGTATNDSVVITRGPVGTGTPFVDVTNAPVTVPNDVTTYAVSGTNNAQVVGFMWVSNATVGGSLVSFAATPSWTASAISLAVGANTLVVYGTNALGAAANDSVVITRGPVGTGTPFVDVTNAPVTVSNEVLSYAVSGTNNEQVVGGMWVTNLTAEGAALSFAASPSWTAPAVPIAMGANTIRVYGSNTLGVTAYDEVVVTWSGAFIAITNPAAVRVVVPFAQTTMTVVAAHVGGVGGITVSVNHYAKSMHPAANPFSCTVPLQVGPNVIRVFITNVAGAVASDTVMVERRNNGGHLAGWGYNNFGQTDCPAGSNYVAVAAGYDHAVALRDDGTLTAWGDNGSGQINSPAGNNYVAVAGGGYHSLALRNDGTLEAWGDNTNGQTNCPAGSTYVAVAAGQACSLALRADGTLDAWGDNTSGQTNCPSGNDYVGVAVGGMHAVALRADGTLVAWGDNSDDQTNCPADNDCIAIAAGYYHSLALRANGMVVAWGDNAVYQTNCPAGSDFVDIAAGGWHSLALRNGGTLAGWGFNLYGQTNCPAGPVYLASAAGFYHSIAVVQHPDPFVDVTNAPITLADEAGMFAVAGTNNTSVVGGMWVTNLTAGGAALTFAASPSWKAPAVALASGANTIRVYGSNAIGVTTHDDVAVTWTEVFLRIINPAAVRVVVPFAQPTMTVVAADVGVVGGIGVVVNHTATNWYAAANPFSCTVPLQVGPNLIRVFGTNVVGAVMRDTVMIDRRSLGGSVVAWGSLTTVPPGRDYVDVAGGGDFGLALAADGSIVGWGESFQGETNCPGGTGYIDIKAGLSHSVALAADGSLTSWGSASDGATNCPSGNDYAAVAAGKNISIAMRRDGSLVGWGANWGGQTTCPAGNGYVAISAGGDHIVALTADGTLVGWGDNNFGQTNCPTDGGYVAVAAGFNHCLAQKADGTVVGWGDNYGGVIDCPTDSFIAVAAGNFHNVALTRQHRLTAWGDNWSNETLCPPGENYDVVAAGQGFSLAIEMTAPGLGITNPPVRVWDVTNDVTAFRIVATNSGIAGNIGVVVNNGATNWQTAVSPFATNIGLRPGATHVKLVATNILGVWANAGATIQQIGPPFVDIATPAATVSASVATYAVAGTNNDYVVGDMLLSNATIGGVAAVFPVRKNWVSPTIGLAVTNIQVGIGAYSWETPMFTPMDDSRTQVIYPTNEIGVGACTITSLALNVTAIPTIPMTNWTIRLRHAPLTSYGPRPAWATDWTVVYRTDETVGAPGWRTFVLTTPFNYNGVDSLMVDFSINAEGLDGSAFPGLCEHTAVSENRMIIYGSPSMDGDPLGWPTNGYNPEPYPTNIVPNIRLGLVSAGFATGANVLVVYGSNMWGWLTNDSVTIVRGAVAGGAPYIDITTMPVTVAHDVTAYAVAGTNNALVVGGMWVSNATVGGARIAFASGANWIAPAMGLAVGANTLVVYGTNVVAATTNDSVVITRGPIGTGRPFVDVTNAPVIVQNDVTAYAVAGTNNVQVVGGMWVTNATVGGSRIAFAAAQGWTAPPIGLVVGPNTLIASGTNAHGVKAADTVTVSRLTPGIDITPFLDITNADYAVDAQRPAASIGGTNNPYVVGTMWFSNAANGMVTTLAAAPKWRALGIPLLYGTNQVHAYGTNIIGMVVHDSVRIVRKTPSMPLISITNAPPAVQVPLSALKVSGLNENIVGGMAWIDGSQRTNWFAATSPGWSIVLPNLVKGSNTVTVIGTNGFGTWAQDSAVIIGTNPLYVLNTTMSGLGTVTLSPPGGVYELGTVVTMAALPGLDHVFAGWSGGAAGGALTAIVAMTSAKSVTATFTPLQPAVVSFAINDGDMFTSSRAVTLDSVCTNSPTHFIASELPSFSNATWEAYAPSVPFTIGSAGTGDKTVYFKVRNAAGETARIQDTIYYSESTALTETGFYMRLVEQDITVGNLFHIELYSSLTQTWDHLCQSVRRSGASQGRFLILDAQPGEIVATSLFHAATGPTLDSFKIVTWSNTVDRPDNGILAHLTCYADSPGRTRISYVATPGSTFVSNTCALAVDTDILASPNNHLDGMTDLEFPIAPPPDGIQMSLEIDRELANTGEYVAVFVNLNHSGESWYDRASILLEYDSTVLALSNVTFGLSPDTTEITVNPDGRSNALHIAAGWDNATLDEGEFVQIGFVVTSYGNCKISLLPPDVTNETWDVGTTVTRVGFDVLGSGATWLDVPSPVWLMCVWPGSYALLAEASEQTPYVGDEIDVVVSAHAAGPGSIDAVGFSLGYDGTLIELVGCVPNEDEGIEDGQWQQNGTNIWLTATIDEETESRDIDVATLSFRILRPGTARINFRFLPPPGVFDPGSTYVLRDGNDVLGSPYNPADGVAGCSLSIAAIEGDGDAVLSIQGDSTAARGAFYDAYLVGEMNDFVDPAYLEAHVSWDPDVFSYAGLTIRDPALSLTTSLDADAGILALYGPALLDQCIGTIAVVRLRAIDSGDTTIALIPPETSADPGTRLLDAYDNDLLGSLDDPEDGMVENDVSVMDAEAYNLELCTTNETVAPGVPFFIDIVLTNACNGFFYTNIGVLVEYCPDDVMVLAVSNVGLGSPDASVSFCTVTDDVGYCGISCSWASPTNAVGVLARVWAMPISDWDAEFAFSFNDEAYAYPGTFVLDADLDVLGEQDFEEDGISAELEIPNAGMEAGTELFLPSWPPLIVGDRSSGSIVLSNYSSALCSEVKVVLQYDKEYIEVEAVSAGVFGGTVVQASIDHGEGIVTYHEVFDTPRSVAGEVCRIDIFARRDGDGSLWLVPISEELEVDGTFSRFHQLDVLGAFDDYEDGGADAEAWIEIATNAFPSLWLDDYNILEMTRGCMVYATPLDDYLVNRDAFSDSLVWSLECVEGPKPYLAVIPPLPPYTALIYPQRSFVGTQLFKIAVCDAANPGRSSYDYIKVVFEDAEDIYQPAGIVTSQVAQGASTFRDADGDTWSYKYVSESGICTYSTGVFLITGGTDDDILAVSVTKADAGDGAVNIEAIETDGGFRQLTLQGSLNRLNATGALGTVSIKNGNLGDVRASSLKKLQIITPLSLARTEDAFTSLSDSPHGLVGSVEIEGSIGSISVRGGDVGSLNDCDDYGQTIRSRTGSIGALTASCARRSFGAGEDKYSYIAGGNIYAHVLTPSGPIGKVTALGGNIGWDNFDRPALIHAGTAIGKVMLKWPKMADEYAPGLLASIITTGSIQSVSAICADIGTDYMQTCIACSSLKTLRVLQWKHAYNDDGPWTDFYGGNLYVNVLASGSIGSVVGSGESFMPCVIAAGDIKQVKSILSKDSDKWVFGGIMDGVRVAAGLTTGGVRSSGSLKSLSAGADIFNSVIQGGCVFADRQSGYLGGVGSIKTGGELSDSVIGSSTMPKLKLKGPVSATTYYINGTRQ